MWYVTLDGGLNTRYFFVVLLADSLSSLLFFFPLLSFPPPVIKSISHIIFNVQLNENESVGHGGGYTERSRAHVRRKCTKKHRLSSYPIPSQVVRRSCSSKKMIIYYLSRWVLPLLSLCCELLVRSYAAHLAGYTGHLIGISVSRCSHMIIVISAL